MKSICTDYHNVKFVAHGCGDLTALRYKDGDRDAIASTWRPTWRERLQILFGTNIMLMMLGTEQPPVTLKTEKDFMGDME